MTDRQHRIIDKLGKLVTVFAVTTLTVPARAQVSVEDAQPVLLAQMAIAPTLLSTAAGQAATAPTKAEKDKTEAEKCKEECDKPKAVSEYLHAVIGGGLSRSNDDYVDFEVKDNVLLTKNDSRFRPAALAGFIIDVWDISWLPKTNYKKTLGIWASMEFAEGGRTVLDGIVLGGALQINPHAYVTLGYSRRRGQEISHGFREAATKVIAENRATHPDKYGRFELNGQGTDLVDLEDWDGLSLLDPADAAGKKTFFPGNPIIDSFNSSVVFGVVIPVKFDSIFGGAKETKK